MSDLRKPLSAKEESEIVYRMVKELVGLPIVDVRRVISRVQSLVDKSCILDIDILERERGR